MVQKLLPILVFSLFAFGFSWLADQFVPPLALGPVDVKTIGTGLGPALSGLLCYTLFKTPNINQISFGGSKPILVYAVTLLALLLPLVMSHKSTTYIMAGSIFTQFIYTLGEEMGWRYYLQNATSYLSQWTQAAVIGIIWFSWHYSILADPTTMLTGQAIPFYIGMPGLILLLTLLSQLLGRIVLRTQSILLPTIIHYMGKVGSGTTVLILGGIVLIIYVLWSKLPPKKEFASSPNR